MACDEDVIPNAERIKAITDDSDLHPRPRSPADHQRRYLLGVWGGSARVTQPAPDQLQIAQAARTIAQQMQPADALCRFKSSVEWGGGDFCQLPPRPMSGTEPLPPWRPLLRGAREREGRSPQARWLQLATLAPDGTPRVRTLVFRGWAGATALDLFTDDRSAKPAELVHQPAVELCWLLPRARSQFRLRGSLQTLAPELVQKERERHWQMLSPGGRALWGWPPPGEPFDPEAAFPEQLPDGSPLPDHFQLLRIALAQVELLELTGHPHRRRRWRGESGWAEERLNP